MRKFKGIFLGIVCLVAGAIFIWSSLSNRSDAKEILKITKEGTAIIKERKSDEEGMKIKVLFKGVKGASQEMWVKQFVNRHAWENSPVNSEQPVLYTDSNPPTLYIKAGVTSVANKLTQVWVGIGLLLLGFIGIAVAQKNE